MKLYYSKGACSLAVRILIHELGLTSEFEVVNLKTKQTETGKNYLTINPKGSVPALLLDNNEVLTENAVIQQYLAEKAHTKTMFPDSGLDRYRILEWLNYIGSELHKNAGAFFNPNITEEAKENVYRPILQRKLDFIEKHLEKNKFLLSGSDFLVGFNLISDDEIFDVFLEFIALEKKFFISQNPFIWSKPILAVK